MNVEQKTVFIFNRILIDFFKEISLVNNKAIIFQIDKNIVVFINDIELERLIDNNITNAIKHGAKNGDIKIDLKIIKTEIILNIISPGKPIINADDIFKKNYRESNSEKGMGLGLHIVKKICDKNNILHEISNDGTNNIFTYIFIQKQ